MPFSILVSQARNLGSVLHSATLLTLHTESIEANPTGSSFKIYTYNPNVFHHFYHWSPGSSHHPLLARLLPKHPNLSLFFLPVHFYSPSTAQNLPELSNLLRIKFQVFTIAWTALRDLPLPNNALSFLPTYSIYSGLWASMCSSKRQASSCLRTLVLGSPLLPHILQILYQ